MRSVLVGVVLLCALSVQAKERVVATLSDLGAIARAVGGNDVEVNVLAAPTEDPHFVEAKPDKVLVLARADLLLLNGMELEVGWLPVLVTNSRNGNIQLGAQGYLDCSTLVTPKEVPLQKLDRSMGDIHPGGNPHYTKDPRNAIEVANGIAARLSEIDPSHAKDYAANAKAFGDKLTAELAQWSKQLAPFKGTPVITYHKSWIYFTDWAGLDEVGFIEPKPGLPPSTGHVASVFQIIQQHHVPMLLQESWYSPATAELLASHTSAKLVRVPGMPALDQSYDDYFAGVVKQVVTALSSK
jgi:zinc/manganese transport system substrate-binding protein